LRGGRCIELQRRGEPERTECGGRGGARGGREKRLGDALLARGKPWTGESQVPGTAALARRCRWDSPCGLAHRAAAGPSPERGSQVALLLEQLPCWDATRPHGGIRAPPVVDRAVP